MEYSLAKRIKDKAEEKYEPINMTISQNEFILVNNETRLDSLRYEIENDMLYLYDTNRYRFIMVRIGLKLLSTVRYLKHLRIKGMVRFNLINILIYIN
jgi:hypothetical protein